MQDKMRLNFVGTVTAVAKLGALKLCSVFGQELYVVGDGCSTLASERFVHACTLPVYDTTQHAIITPKIILRPKRKEVKFTFAWREFMTLKTIEVPLTIYYLEPINEDVGQTDLLVYKGPFDTEARLDSKSVK